MVIYSVGPWFDWLFITLHHQMSAQQNRNVKLLGLHCIWTVGIGLNISVVEPTTNKRGGDAKCSSPIHYSLQVFFYKQVLQYIKIVLARLHMYTWLQQYNYMYTRGRTVWYIHKFCSCLLVIFCIHVPVKITVISN